MLDSFFAIGPHSPLTLTTAIAFISVSALLLLIAIRVSLRYGQMLQQSQKSESQLRAVVDTAVDAIIMINGQVLIQSFNGAAEAMLGWRAEEVIGRVIIASRRCQRPW